MKAEMIALFKMTSISGVINFFVCIRSPLVLCLLGI